MNLNLYEIDHGGVQDWVIAESTDEALDMLEMIQANISCHFVSYRHCKVTALEEDLQTMTNRGIMTVRQIIDHYSKPCYVKAG